MLKQLVAGIVATVILTGAAAAGPFEDATTAYRRGDYTEALRLIRPLAEQGNAAARNNLGVMYENGEGVPQDYAEAARWYRLAAEQGHVDAQVDLGLMYASGQGVPQNHAEAVKWMRMAAGQGFAVAQLYLGVSYGNGEGVPQDIVLAHMWWNLAAAKGNEMAMKNRDLAASHMTPDQLAEAQRLAREWKPGSER